MLTVDTKAKNKSRALRELGTFKSDRLVPLLAATEPNSVYPLDTACLVSSSRTTANKQERLFPPPAKHSV